jgi:hypothetical protein
MFICRSNNICVLSVCLYCRHSLPFIPFSATVYVCVCINIVALFVYLVSFYGVTVLCQYVCTELVCMYWLVAHSYLYMSVCICQRKWTCSATVWLSILSVLVIDNSSIGRRSYYCIAPIIQTIQSHCYGRITATVFTVDWLIDVFVWSASCSY